MRDNILFVCVNNRMKDEAAGEVPVAFVVKSNGSVISEDEIKQFISKQVKLLVLLFLPTIFYLWQMKDLYLSVGFGRKKQSSNQTRNLSSSHQTNQLFDLRTLGHLF